MNLFLALRPFQAVPLWQSLNMQGGVSPVRRIEYTDGTVRVNGERSVISLTPVERFGAAAFDQGPITGYIAQNSVPGHEVLEDPFGYASAALQYGLDVPPGSAHEVYIAVPLHDTILDLPRAPDGDRSGVARSAYEEAVAAWSVLLDRIELRLPPEAQPVANTFRSTLGYILINRDGPALQPGSRNYARSWIRDGALTSAALLGTGYTAEVRDYIQWYARFQYEDGKIPCCVDPRGPDPTPEHDSNGEFIYTVMEYYRYTRDIGFLRQMWPAVVRATDYLDRLRQMRMTEEFQAPEKKAYFGMLPESISHEGYSAHPVHAYWDGFFALRGFKDAAAMAKVLGDDVRAESYGSLAAEFSRDLHASLALTRERHSIEYLPGSVELGDFDATSTTVAIAPAAEMERLDPAALRATFDTWWRNFEARRDGTESWGGYTPYEWRVVGTLVRMGERERAKEALDWFMESRRPAAWNHWAEVVWREPREPRFLGDMPHTWIGADFLRAIRSLFAYERESDGALVLAAGLPRAWVESPGGVGIKRLPTWHGTLAYDLQASEGSMRMVLKGDITVPAGGIVLRPPLRGPIKSVTVNGRPIQDFDPETVTLREFPAEVEIVE